jgi:hypothetical protein
MILRASTLALTLAALLSGCVQPAPNGSGSGDSATPPSGASSSQDSDWAKVLRLEEQAKAIARVSGCADGGACRTAPVGNRACGGPRYYIAYCSTTTDSVALFRKLAEVAAAEDAFNQKYQMASTCEYRMPGPVALAGGECRMATQSGQ